MYLPRYFGAVALTAVLLGVVTAQNSTASLPVLDLGYALHRAAAFNVIIKLPIFVNLYANISLGSRRVLQLF